MVLAGTTVLDLTSMLPGPFCTMFLADFGAEVIKVERPVGKDKKGWPPQSKEGVVRRLIFDRGKKSITLNLKEPEGQEIFWKLVRGADVLMESFRPGVMDRLGLGFNKLRQENPKLIYCALSGYGQTGPYRNRPAHQGIA